MRISSCMIIHLERDEFYSLSDLSASNIELGLLFVEPNHIGTGIGRILIEHAKNHAIACGGRTLQFQGDPNAEDFYKAVGATLTGKRESSCISGRFLRIFFKIRGVDLVGSL